MQRVLQIGPQDLAGGAEQVALDLARVSALISNRDACRSMGARAFDRAARLFNLQNTIRDYLDYYESVRAEWKGAACSGYPATAAG